MLGNLFNSPRASSLFGFRVTVNAYSPFACLKTQGFVKKGKGSSIVIRAARVRNETALMSIN